MAYRDFLASRATKWVYGLLLVLCVGAGPAAFGQGAPDGDGEDGQTEAAGADSGTTGSAQRPMIRMGFDSQGLARHLPDQAIWLEPEDYSPVLALFEPETTAEARGGILLLADQGQSANGPLLAALRPRLADAGWGTLSMGVEEVPPAVMAAIRRQTTEAERRAGGNGDDEGVSSVMIDVDDGTGADMLERYYQQHQARLAEALSWLGGQGYQEQVVVVIGWSGTLLHRSLLSGLSGPTRVVWIAPDFSGADQSDLVRSFRAMAVLDLYADDRGATRAAAFRRAGVEGYRSSVVATGPRPGERDAAALAGRIISWLKR